MKLTGHELKKLFGQRLLLWITVVLLVANAVVAYCFTEKDENCLHLKAVEADYINDPDAVRAYYAELEAYAGFEFFEKTTDRVGGYDWWCSMEMRRECIIMPNLRSICIIIHSNWSSRKFVKIEQKIRPKH